MTRILNAAVGADLTLAIELLKAGDLVAVPTETVCGLAADARQPHAVRKIFAAKGRPENHPLIVHLGGVEELDNWAIRIPNSARSLVEHYWPGPLTLVLEKGPHVSPVVTGGRNTVALRMPAHPAMLSLLQAGKFALAAPSANPHKSLSPTSAQQVVACMQDKVVAVLDGGECELGIESTILDLTSPEPQVLRAGPITASQLADFLAFPIAQPHKHNIAVPGNMPVHYRPKTPLKLKASDQILVDPGFPVVRLLLSDDYGSCFAFARMMPHDKPAYARLLYRALYEADQFGAQEIWIELPPATEEWLDVLDRLGRAASV